MNSNKVDQGVSSARSKFVKGIILRMKIQRMIKIWKKKVKKSRQRINILKQWVVTEESYIKDLNLIIEKIQKPMLEAQLITHEQDRILFPNLDAMLKLSKELLTEVKGFLSKFHPHTTLIGNSLINFYKYFIIYREYCNNFYKAQKIIKQVKKNPKSQSIGSSLTMDIQSYIIKPVQRPPKYQLLLRQYLKALDPKHKDYEALTIAISKYHDVNEENNQSMDLQIRGQKMIELDKKYSGIINASRVFLFQQFTKDINQIKLKLYVFNDLILVVKVHYDDREEGYKKIFLDGQSFVNLPMDGKYFTSLLFICGNKENLHCLFGDNSMRDKVYEKINNVIHELCRKQSNRVKRKKTKIKMAVMKIQQIQIKTKPKLRITVAGVEKRLKSSLNLVNYDTFYILKIQAPFPNDIFQYSYLKFQELLAIEKQIRGKNKILNIPILDDKPTDMGMYDVKKNMTKIIQSRELYIERFINFILRSEQFQQFTDFIVSSLKINQDLWQFINVNQRCTCEICSQQKQSISFQEFKQKKQFIKSMVGSPNGLNKSRSSIDSFTSQSSNYMKSDSSICLFNNFLMPNKISEVSADELNTLEKRLTWLETKEGRIDYSLIQKNEGDNNIKVNICLLSLQQDEIITVKISKKITALEVLDQIATMYAIQTMRDFGLFLVNQGVPRLIDRDEKLWEVLNDIQYQFEEATQPKEGGFWKKLNYFKKWGEQIITGKKSKLYLKKYLFVSEQLEIKACQENPQRYSIIVQEVFYRFKHEILLLNKADTKRLCALYYVINYMDKLAHLNEANFQKDKIKNILPESRWSLFEQEEFQNQIYHLIKEYEIKMENTPLPLRRKSKLSSTMFSKIQVAYGSVIKLVYKVIGWNTVFFYVNNYDPPSLPGSCTQLLLGVNRKYLIIIRPKQLQPLVQIQLKTINYKVTFKSIFIFTDDRVLRFDGQMIYDIKKLISSYKLMLQKFNQP